MKECKTCAGIGWLTSGEFSAPYRYGDDRSIHVSLTCVCVLALGGQSTRSEFKGH